MKKIRQNLVFSISAFLFLILFLPDAILGQTPQTFNYQAVLRDGDTKIRSSENTVIQVSIHQGSESGTEVYSELHSVMTTAFGLINLEIGSKNPANFTLIDWADGPYYMKVFVDGVEMGTSQLLSVPFALYSANGQPGEKGDQGDPGPPGIQGEKGDQGDPGAQGVQGEKGDDGPQGIQGEKGDPGAQGIQGVKGDKGDTGDTGPQGPPGIIEENSVGSSHVINNSLTANDLAVGSVGKSEIADMNRTISVPAGSLTSTSSYVSSDHRGWQMNASYHASVTGYIALPANYAGGNVTVTLYFVNKSGLLGVVDFFIRAAGRSSRELLSDPGSINPSGGISVSSSTYTLYRQDFTVTNISTTDDILHLYAIQRGGSSETHTGTVVLVGVEVQYLASY